jgi:hypothetical protein
MGKGGIMLLIRICGALAAATFLSSAAHAELNFNRVATFSVASNLSGEADASRPTVAEIIAATMDGMTLIYTDSPQESVGFIDISDPANPRPAGALALAGEPTSVVVSGGNALVAVVTSEEKANPSGLLATIDVASKSTVATCDLGGQPDSLALSPDGTKLAIVIENERDEEVNDGTIPQLPSGLLVTLDVVEGVVDCGSIARLELTGVAAVAPEDAEPEYVDINDSGQAVITLQENNHIVVADVSNASIVRHFSAGTVDLIGIDL